MQENGQRSTRRTISVFLADLLTLQTDQFRRYIKESYVSKQITLQKKNFEVVSNHSEMTKHQELPIYLLECPKLRLTTKQRSETEVKLQKSELRYAKQQLLSSAEVSIHKLLAPECKTKYN